MRCSRLIASGSNLIFCGAASAADEARSSVMSVSLNMAGPPMW
jgi:hypothetical protein